MSKAQGASGQVLLDVGLKVDRISGTFQLESILLCWSRMRILDVLGRELERSSEVYIRKHARNVRRQLLLALADLHGKHARNGAQIQEGLFLVLWHVARSYLPHR